MGQKQSKLKNKKSHSKNTMIRKMDGSKLSASSLGNGPDTLGLTIAPAGDDELSAGEEGHANLLVPKRSNNICGVFLQTLVIMAPIDDCIERDLGIFELFNYDEPEDKMWAYIARPEVSKENAIESFKALCQVLNVVPPAHKNHFPKHHVSGKLKRLVYGMDSYQSVEHDPEWIGRLAMIVSLPSNGVFLSSVLAFSPTGTVWTWLALLIGLGMVNALKALHEMGFVHRYVTPWNFLLQIPFEMETIQHGILHADLSLAARWPMKKMQLATPFVGTIKYSSKRALTRHNQGPADDFISVIYIVAELISGKLPWRAIKNIDECAIMKQKFPQSIQYKRLPRELRVIYQMLYRTYGLKKADSEAVSTAFKKALYRRAADWDTRDFPDWLSMPPDDAD